MYFTSQRSVWASGSRGSKSQKRMWKKKLNSFLLFSQPALHGPCSCQEFFMTIAIAQNLLNIDSTEFKLRSIYSNQGLLDVSWILVLFLIIELCTLAANTLEKGFPACCFSLSEMKAWQCGFAFKNSKYWNFSSVASLYFPSARVSSIFQTFVFCL